MAAVTYAHLLQELHGEPFQPFRIILSDGRHFDVSEPSRVLVGESSAVVVSQTREDERGYRVALDWRTISIAHIVEFQDIDVPPRRKRKRT